MTRETCDVVLVAGGSSSRFQGQLPKQFELINGRPLYSWSLDVFLNWSELGTVVVVVPKDWVEPVRESFNILEKKSLVQVVAGGSSRQASATLGLEALTRVSDSEWVMIHDAARPCLTDELLERLWTARKLEGESGGQPSMAVPQGGALPVAHGQSLVGGVIPGIPAAETIKLVEPFEGAHGVVETLPRAQLRVIQTPQLFKRKLLSKAYDSMTGLDAVDDALLLEKMGFKVIVVDGDYDNVKVTFSEDKDRVSSWLRKRHPQI